MTAVYRQSLGALFARNFRRCAGWASGFAWLFVAVPALAQPGAAQSGTQQSAATPDAEAATPVVVEMFLSQSCRSCPPAADYITDLAERPGVIALAWHVDYWNLLANRKTGRWQDPFSKASYAERQKRYNRNIRERSTVFTPQAIIDGVMSTVGSNRREVEEKILMAKFINEKASPAPPQISFRKKPEGKFAASISGVPTAYDVHLVSFYTSAVTDVKGGDNAGVLFAEAHVVDRLDILARNQTGGAEFEIDAPPGDMGCAILVQEPELGRIAAARYCPSAARSP